MLFPRSNFYIVYRVLSVSEILEILITKYLKEKA